MKSKWLVCIASVFMVLCFVGGAVCLNVDRLFVAPASELSMDEDDKAYEVQASGLWDDYRATSLSGSGTSSRPYQISTPEQLARYAYLVNDGSGKNSYAELVADINLSAHYWLPIGCGINTYSGHFDGNGHSIFGLTIGDDGLSTIFRYDGMYAIGLFGVVSDATIENLSLKDGLIENDPNNLCSVGAFAGVALGGSEFSLLADVGIQFDISGNIKTAIGGIVGTAEASTSFENCFNYSSIPFFSKSTLANWSMGGIVGVASGSVQIKSCANLGDIIGKVQYRTGTGYGGIVGVVGGRKGSPSIIEDCVNYGVVSISTGLGGQSSCVGGIVGWGMQSVYVNRCINYANVNGTANVGGIAGKMGNVTGNCSLWGISYSESAPLTDFLVSNCINYMSGLKIVSNSKGEVVGYSANTSNVLACYTISTNSNIQKSTFFKTPANSMMSSHSEDFSGEKNGVSISGWGKISVGLNGDNGSGEWVLTTILFDMDYISGIDEDFPYSMVPAEMVGTVNFRFRHKYYKDSDIDSNYEDVPKEDDAVYLHFNMILGTSVENINLRTYDFPAYYGARNGYGQFYYIKGFSYKEGYEQARLDVGLMSPINITSNVALSSPPTWVVSSLAIGDMIGFDMGMFSNSVDISFELKFESGDKKSSIGVVYNIVDVEEGEDRKYNAKISRKIIEYANLTRDNYADEYVTIIDEIPDGGYYSQYHHYWEDVEVTIKPAPGYAVMCVWMEYSELSTITDKEYDESKTLNENVKPVNEYFDSGRYIKTIKPSDYGDVSVEFNYMSSEMMVFFYLIPVEYELEIVCGEQEETASASSTAIEVLPVDDEWKTFEVNGSFYIKDRGVLAGGSPLQVPFDKYLQNGFGYSIYASTTPDIYENYSGKERVSLHGGTNTLNENQELSFSLYDLLLTAIKNGGINSGTLYVLVVRDEVEYSVNFVHMVNSFTDPNLYLDRTEEKIGGDTYTNDVLFQSGDRFGYFISPKYGYENVGLSFEKFSTLNDDVTTSLSGIVTSSYSSTESYRQSMDNDNATPKFTYKYVDFDDLLDSYLAFIGTADESEIEGITIYVYFKLGTYLMEITSTVYEENGTTNYSSSNFTFESENSEDWEGYSNANSNYLGKEAYFFAPVRLYAKELEGTRFVGWFYGDIRMERENRFLSNQREYEFVNSANMTKRAGVTNTYEYSPQFVICAVYVKMSYDETPLAVKGKNLIEISSAQDLIRLSTSVQNGNTFEGYVLRQTADIDMSGHYFMPIGTEDTPFMGTYDGQNHFISKIKYGISCRYMDDIGLFAWVEDATIQNLTIKNSNFTSLGIAGAFVARSKNSNFYNLINYNCTFEKSISAYTIYGINVSDVGNTDDYVSSVFRYTYDYKQLPYSESIPILVWMSTAVPMELQLAGVEGVTARIYQDYEVYSWSLGENITAQSNLTQYYGSTGGIVGEMSGGVIRGCSVYMKEVRGLNMKSVDENSGFVVGFAEGEVTIDQCMFETPDTILGYLPYYYNIVGTISLSNVKSKSNVTVSNCYIRTDNYSRYYYAQTASGSIYSTDYTVDNFLLRVYGNDSNTKNIGNLDENIWFRLPNGWWTLRIFYWT